MTVSARDVSAALRERLRVLPKVKEHKLLYYCQGHHLATFGEPLFKDTIAAWDMGPVVVEIWRADKYGEAIPGSAETLDQAQLNTVGYVVSRYGKLTGKDLIKLTHAEDPWQIANRNRRPADSACIEHEWMRDYFRNNSIDEDDALLDSEAVEAWLAEAAEARPNLPPPRTNTRDEILARLGRG